MKIQADILVSCNLEWTEGFHHTFGQICSSFLTYNVLNPHFGGKLPEKNDNKKGKLSRNIWLLPLDPPEPGPHLFDAPHPH